MVYENFMSLTSHLRLVAWFGENSQSMVSKSGAPGIAADARELMFFGSAIGVRGCPWPSALYSEMLEEGTNIDAMLCNCNNSWSQ